jgi:hypothetical protein
MMRRLMPERPGARLARAAGLAVVGVALVAAVAFVLLPLLGRGVVYIVEGFAAASLSLITSIGNGASIWSVLGTVAKAGAIALMTPAASGALALLVLVGVLALYGLLRLLDSEKEPSP